LELLRRAGSNEIQKKANGVDIVRSGRDVTPFLLKPFTDYISVNIIITELVQTFLSLFLF
jgi:hypothetical protein